MFHALKRILGRCEAPKTELPEGKHVVIVNGEHILCDKADKDEVLKAELKKLPGNKTLDFTP